MNTDLINIQVLALLGDAVYSLYIRKKLIENGINNANILQEKLKDYVSAKGQVEVLNNLMLNNLLNEKELELIKRGRNYKNNSHPKGTNIVTYKLSTGLEFLFGNLYFNDKKRLQEILNSIEVK